MLIKRKRGRIGIVAIATIILIIVMAGILLYAIWKSAMTAGGI